MRRRVEPRRRYFRSAWREPVISIRSLSMQRKVQFWMKASLTAGLAVLGLKAVAYGFSHSQALLADLAESLVHQFAVGLATYLSYLQAKPADTNHPHGHGKFGYISSGTEGLLILLTGVFILVSTVTHLSHPAPVAASGVTVALVVGSLVINGALGLVLLREAKKLKSLSLEANGHHVFTDSWTSLGALLSLILVFLTGRVIFDSVVSLAIGVVILISGLKISWQAFHGLTDGIDDQLYERIKAQLDQHCADLGVSAHSVQLRHDSVTLWLHAHITIDGARPLSEVHALLTAIEERMGKDHSEIRCYLHPEPENEADHDSPVGETAPRR